ncbi:unnamed protein product [Symbiodinium sp. KB8]|nr:unnamed protein product [Symbiodinium sp. KB8]
MSLSLLKEVEQRYLYDHWWPPESQRFTIHMEHDDLKADILWFLGSFLTLGCMGSQHARILWPQGSFLDLGM